MRRALPLLAIVVAVAGGWSSASAKSALSHRALIAGLNSACTKDHATVVAIRLRSLALAPADYDGAAALFAVSLKALETEATSIGKLTPPATDRAAYRAFRSVIGRGVAYTKKVLAGLRAHDADAVIRLRPTFTKLVRQQVATATAVGAERCEAV